MKEQLPVNTGAGRIEYKMNDETKNSDGFFDRHKDKIVRGVAGALAVTSVGAAVEGIIPKNAYAASAVVDKYSGEVPSEKELNNVFAKNGLVLATSETVAKPEKQSELSKINVVFQVGNPYYVTFDLDKYTFAVTKLDASPVIDPKSGRTMVPVGFVGQSMGYEKQWDNKNKIVTFKKGDRTVVHKVGTKIYDIKVIGKPDQKIVSDSTSYIDSKTGRTMVGLRSCLNSFGIKDEEIGYDSKSKLIYCNFNKEEQAELAKIPMGGGPNYEAEREALKFIKPDFKDNGDVQKLDDEMKKQGYAVFAMSGVTVVMPESIYSDTSNKINAYEKAILLSTDVYEAEIVKRVKLDQYAKDPNKTKLIWQQKSGSIYGFDGSNGQNVYNVNGNEKTKVQYNAKTGEFKEEKAVDKLTQAEIKRVYSNIIIAIDCSTGRMGVRIKNPLKLNKEEAEKFLKTGSDEGLKTFQIFHDSDGRPAFFIVTSQEDGFLNDATKKAIRDAEERLNEWFPNFIREEVVKKNKLVCLTRDVAESKTFEQYPFSTYGATYNHLIFGNVVWINEKYLDEDEKYNYRGVIQYIIGESRAAAFINGDIKDEDKLHKSGGVDKFRYEKNLLNSVEQGVIPKDDFNFLMENEKLGEERYLKRYEDSL